VLQAVREADGPCARNSKKKGKTRGKGKTWSGSQGLKETSTSSLKIPQGVLKVKKRDVKRLTGKKCPVKSLIRKIVGMGKPYRRAGRRGGERSGEEIDLGNDWERLCRCVRFSGRGKKG